MSICRILSCVVGRECLLWPERSLGKTLLAFVLLHSAFQGQICLLPQVFLYFLLLHSSPLQWKVGSQETPGVTGKFGLRVQNEAGQRLIEYCQENTLVIANILFQQHKRRLYTWTSPMVNIEIRLIIFFAVKDGKAPRVRINRTGSWLWLRSWTAYCKIQT